jgi:hypothetical protein
LPQATTCTRSEVKKQVIDCAELGVRIENKNKWKKMVFVINLKEMLATLSQLCNL